MINKLITEHRSDIERFSVLDSYYRGKAPIQKRVKDLHKPNNKLIAPYPSYIVDVLTGIFIGEPVSYSVEEEQKHNLDVIQEIFDYNDEQDQNFELAKTNGKAGKAYEIVYVDENNKIRFNELDPRSVIYVKDNKINPEPLFAIYFQGEGENRIVKVFTKEHDLTFLGSDLELTESIPNVTGKIKIIECTNNNEKLGDFERVLPLVNDYNKTISDVSNDLEEFADAMLVLSGMLNTDAEDIAQMKRDKIILLAGESQGAEWLIKNPNIELVGSHLKTLDEDIHRFTKIPNLTDEKFGGNSSGVALKYKLLALQQVISAKQRKFKRFLQDRLELILAYSRWLSLPIDLDFQHYDVGITFNSNIPIDEEANVRLVKDLMTMTSKSTALSELYFVDNANYELDKIRQEEEMYSDNIAKYFLEGEEDAQAGKE